MIIVHRIEWHGTEGCVARNMEWEKRIKEKEKFIKNKSLVPFHLNVHPYTEANRVGDFWHMLYGLWYEESTNE